MIIQSTERFVASLNRLSRTDAATAKRYLLPLCEAIETLAHDNPLAAIALSDYQIFEEQGRELAASVGNDKIYGIFFDQFYLAVAVIGKIPRICRLLLIRKKTGN